MSWAIASVALSAVSGLLQYNSARATYKAQKKIQAYQNKMTNVANALNQNAITSNILQAQQQTSTQATRVQQKGSEMMGAVNVQAAATGTIGQSADQARLATRQAEAMGEADREDQFESYMTSAYYSRIQSAQSAAMQQDHTYFEKPNLFSYIVNTAAGAANTMSKTQSGSSTSPVDAKSYGSASVGYRWLDLGSYGGTRGW